MKPAPPLCRYCGAAIRKRTECLYVRNPEDAARAHRWTGIEYIEGAPKTRAEAQQLVGSDLRVVAVSFDERRTVRRIYVWDGKSYVDAYFCCSGHAVRMAYLMAAAGRCTDAYNEATAARAFSEGLHVTPKESPAETTCNPPEKP